ncbi:MAG: hypothetical protein KBC47_00655 [Candidatus Peribacteraceae bacterium]|nr:hypothetical protein [Candidatus Peribacteraceae bacterium]
MKKLTFLLGTVGGAMAGYVFSNKKLRNEMLEAKDSKEAAKILGKHLSADGQVVAKEVRQLAEQHGLDDSIADGKQYVQDYYSSAKGEVQKFLGAKVKEAKRAVGSVRKSAHQVRKAATTTTKSKKG